MRRANVSRVVLPALVLVISGLLAAGVVVGLGARDDLRAARRHADAAWVPLHSALDGRYATVAAAGDVIEERLGAPRPLVEELRRAVARWKAARTVDGQVQAANLIEGLAARLVVMAEATPKLRSSGPVQAAVAPIAEPPPGDSRRAYNVAVSAYEDSRGGFPRRLVAGAFGFDSRLTFESPV